MTCNENIKQLVEVRKKGLNADFDCLIKRCIGIFSNKPNISRVYIFYDDSLLCCKERFDTYDYDSSLAQDIIPYVYDKYFDCTDNLDEISDTFLCDFEYYLYKNTSFDFYEVSTSTYGKALCIKLPIDEEYCL